MDHPELPKLFVRNVSSDGFLGLDLLASLETKAPNSIRINPSKPSELSFVNAPVSWCDEAYYLNERPIYTKDPLFHAGAYYPQEAGSMFLDKVLKQLELPDEPIVLDLCAAPGGKSTLIASFLNNKGLLVSNEVIQNRARILKENLIKWGYSNTVVVNNDPRDFKRIPSFFDVVVVDAPCSGEGMFRKDPQARTEWSEEHVELCASRQKRIVMDVWEALKPGGFLIYSTCTFNAHENEENIAWLLEELDAELVALDFSPLKPDRNQFGAYALPSLVTSEGFYMAVLQKKEDASTPKGAKLKVQQLTKIKETAFLKPYLNLESVEIVAWNSFLFALPQKFVTEIKLLQQELKIVKFATEIGTEIRGELLPNHALALDASLLTFSNRIELNLDQALTYLKGETFTLDAPRGYQLVCYQGIPLGWIKHLGNRFNNLYPKEWRIRMKI